MVINVFKAMQYPKEEDAEGCMRIDIIEELIKEVHQEEAMQKFQETDPEVVQPQPATNTQPMVEEIQPKADIVQQQYDKFMQ
ncbi:hypothetical protein PIB30_044115 [Stylosanthes scabra]|uniref:Uncharacterized protein n=1 Tax=Stylosanthes scabra TaxID=79078 RepID=A0ABU6RGG4_9FABA|nr:hypothetical protein [Stylosanthes scabra]